MTGVPGPGRRALVLLAVAVLSLAALPLGGAASGTSVFGADATGEAAFDRGRPPVAQVAPTGAAAEGRVVFAPEAFRDIGGEVSTEDGEVTVRGTATGVERVLVVMIGRRGKVATELVSVDDDDQFEEDVALVTPRGVELTEGRVVATVFHPGDDGIVGDGEIRGVTRADLATLDEETRAQIRALLANASAPSLTQEQVLELFYEESLNDTASDDLALVDVFRYADARLSVDGVAPKPNSNESDDTAGPSQTAVGGETANVTVGDTMVVRGRTNLRPDKNTIVVEVVEGPSTEAFDLVEAGPWGTDGVWTAEFDTGTVEPGTYLLRAENGGASDLFEVTIHPRGDAVENATTTEAPSTPTGTPSPEPPDTTETPTPAPTDATGPGLGVATAFVAVVLASLLAGRRRRH